MSSVKSIAVLGVVGFVVASGLKAQRYEGIEADRDAHAAIDNGVRNAAAEYNPNVDLTRRELKNFAIKSLIVSRPKISPLFDTFFGDDRNYDVYVRFTEAQGGERCITLSLKHKLSEDKWSAMREGSDSCAPIW